MAMRFPLIAPLCKGEYLLRRLEYQQDRNFRITYQIHLIDQPNGFVVISAAQPAGVHRQLFLCTPWAEIYVTESKRHHSLDAAVAEYLRLLEAFPSLGYEVTMPSRRPSVCHSRPSDGS